MWSLLWDFGRASGPFCVYCQGLSRQLATHLPVNYRKVRGGQEFETISIWMTFGTFHLGCCYPGNQNGLKDQKRQLGKKARGDHKRKEGYSQVPSLHLCALISHNISGHGVAHFSTTTRGKGRSGGDVGGECWAEGDCPLLWEPGDTPQLEVHQ